MKIQASKSPELNLGRGFFMSMTVTSSGDAESIENFRSTTN
jgi:hypothetical protein